MKKILILFVSFFVIGCSITKNINNTPIKKVEEYLSKYQMNDEEVIDEIENNFEEMKDVNSNEKKEIKNIIKDNYKKMKYEIIKDTIDGNNASVEVKIDVIDYRNIVVTNIEQLKNANEKVTYTIMFELNKKNDVWLIDNINTEILNKINGVY